ncbi:MAG: sulfatase-like hydrolase/transferase [Planctomycetes bacterium]|nr:sulfatase-like hydrolase/transferase [Planctomycetota bacterium]
MNAIILVVDRLQAGYVGAGGNTWIQTPSLDALAIDSIVFDQCTVITPQLERLYGSFWQGEHPSGLAEERSALLPPLIAAGVTTTLVSDEPRVTGHPGAEAFDAVVRLDPPEHTRVVDRIDQTHLARCFARIVDWLESAREPFLLWCHLRGLAAPWDAPLEFRTRYAEEGDPDPPEWAEPPCRMLGEHCDPDELLGISQAYAGQVSLLDDCVGALQEFLQASPIFQSTLFTLASVRGFPLGEHRRVGACDDALYGELVHVPLLMRFPDALGRAARSQALVRLADLVPTLLDWWGIAEEQPSPDVGSLLPLVRGEVESIRDRLCLALGENEWAIRTPAWFLRHADAAELFTKPDDYWEVNNVADRCQPVVELLENAFLDHQRLLQSGRLGELPPLDEILLAGLD